MAHIKSRSGTATAARGRALSLALLIISSSLAHADGPDWFFDFLARQEYFDEQTENGGICHAGEAELKPADALGWREQSSQFDVQVVANDKDGAIVAWLDGGAQLYLRSLDGSGKTLWGPLPIKKTLSAQRAYRMSTDGAGGALVVWQDHRYDCASTASVRSDYVVAQRIDREGRERWGKAGITLADATGVRTHEIVPDGTGGAIVTWYSHVSSPYNRTFIQRLDGAGKLLWDPNGIEVEFDTLEAAHGGSLSDGRDGTSIMVTTGHFDGRGALALKKIGQDGRSTWTARGVLDEAVMDTWPVAFHDDAGGAFIAHTKDGALNVERIDATGASVWNAVLSQPEVGGRHAWLKMVPDGVEGALVMWESSRGDVFAQRVGTRGKTIWKQHTKYAKGDASMAASVAIADGRGGLFSATKSIITLRGSDWTHERPVSAQDIYVHHVDSLGEIPWKAPVLLASHAGKHSHTLPALASDGRGGAIVVWSDGRAGFEIAPLPPEDIGDETQDPQIVGRIYAQRVAPSGDLLWSSGIDISGAPADLSCAPRTSQSAVVAGLNASLRDEIAAPRFTLPLERGIEVQVLERRDGCEVVAGRKGVWTRVRTRTEPAAEGWLFDAELVYPQHADQW